MNTIVNPAGVEHRIARLIGDFRGSGQGRSVVAGLIGRGIGASLSPLMHRNEGRRAGLDYSYHLIDFDMLGFNEANLGEVLRVAEGLGFAGLNVTHPFKQAVIAELDDLSPEAEAIGAVNTVVFAGGRSHGHNTDCYGFAESFRRKMAGCSLASVVQFGAGGAGSAVAEALVQLGVGALGIYDVDEGRASQLAEELAGRTGRNVRALARYEEAIAAADGIVNTTPIGMAKYPGMPLAAGLLAPRHWVAEIIYFPRRTALVEHAESLGCRVLDGAGMAAYQAARAFELFSGVKADGEAMMADLQTA